MDDSRTLLRRSRETIVPPDDVLGSLVRARRRRERNRRISSGVIGLLLAAAVIGGLAAIDAQKPTALDRPPGLFAPIGGWVTYAGPGGIWAVDPDAPSTPGARVRVSGLDGEPLGWTADGSTLLVRTDPYTLMSVHADGSARRIVRTQTTIEGATISPDGTTVVYATTRLDRAPYDGEPEAPSAIWVVATDGGEPKILREAVERWFPGEGQRAPAELSWPVFSSDGTRVAYLDGRPFGGYDVMVMAANGGDPTRVAANILDEPGVVRHLDWSQNGRSFVYDVEGTGVDGTIDGTGPMSIYLVGTDGAEPRLFLDDAMAPHLSPDGTRISYQDDPASETEVGGLRIASPTGEELGYWFFARSGPWNPVTPEA